MLSMMVTLALTQENPIYKYGQFDFDFRLKDYLSFLSKGERSDFCLCKILLNMLDIIQKKGFKLSNL